MAIRFNGSGQYLSRTANLLDPTYNCTIIWWAMPITDLGSLHCTMIGFPELEISMRENGSPDTYNLYHNVSHYGTTGISYNTWTYLALVRNSFTDMKWYVNGSLEITLTDDVSSGDLPPTRIHIGAWNGTSQPWNGSIFNLLMWDTNLSIEEMERQRYQILPVRFENLVGWWPFFSGADRAKDFSGKGYDWTENGALTDESDPPISYGSAIWVVPFVEGTPALTVTISETVTVNETTKPELNLARIVTESISVLESVNSALQFSVVLGENLAVAEQVKLLLAELVSVSETSTLTEQVLAAVSNLVAVVVETVTVTEQFFVSVTDGSLQVNLGETIAISEESKAFLALLVQSSETALLNESAALDLRLSASLQETTTINESIAVAFLLAMAVQESVSVLETVSMQIALGISIADAVGIIEFLNAGIISSPAVVESVALSENFTVVLTGSAFIISVVETVIVSELVNAIGFSLNVNVADLVVLIEQAFVRLPFIKLDVTLQDSVGNIVILSDTAR